MRKCKRNIFLIFGYLLIMAILFVPYTGKILSRGVHGASVIKEERGWIFLPLYFINKDVEDYVINAELLSMIFAIILFAGGFGYIIFCVVLRKYEKK